MVSVTTIYDGIPYDSACVLEAGDHPFISRRSYVVYRNIRLDTDAHVCQMVGQGFWPEHDTCDAALTARVAAGVCVSRLVPREFKRIFACG